MADREGARGHRDRDPDRPRRDRSDRPQNGGFDRPRRDAERPTKRDFDRPRRDFDRPRRDFDRPRRDFDRPRRDFDRPRGGGFDRSAARPPGSGGAFRGHAGGPPAYRRPAERTTTVQPGEFLQAGEELVAGRRPVAEAFAARREARRLLVVPDRRAALESIVLHATTLRLPIIEVEGGTLTSLTGFDGHQGVALAVASRAPATVEQMVARARTRDEAPFILVLDSLEDPQNLGTLLRSAEACGVHGVIYPTRHAAPLTAAAIKSSAGATEHLLMAPVDSLPATLADLRAAGLRLIGADEGAALRYSEADLRGPLALVVGSEERGISGALRRRLDMTVRIPMRGRVASLNAAVAGSILLFAAAEQRGTPEIGDRPELEEPAATAPIEQQPAADGTSEPAADGTSEPAGENEAARTSDGSDSPDAGLLPGGPQGDGKPGG